MNPATEGHDNLPIVFLLGPTASGKTALTLALAEQRDIEIISVDSGQVYRGMDIGTAKPSLAERADTPHHLIDIREPTDPYTAAHFCKDAVRLIGEIRKRACIPVLAGGSMLYFQALELGLAPLPSADPALRAEIVAQAAKFGWPALHRELATVDPAAALRIKPTDPQRLQRALEVYRLTGKPLSELQERRVPCLPEPALKFAPHASLTRLAARAYRDTLRSYAGGRTPRRGPCAARPARGAS